MLDDFITNLLESVNKNYVNNEAITVTLDDVIDITLVTPLRIGTSNPEISYEEMLLNVASIAGNHYEYVRQGLLAIFDKYSITKSDVMYSMHGGAIMITHARVVILIMAKKSVPKLEICND